MKLRLELGEILQKQAELKGKEKKIRTSIKKTQRMITQQYENASGILLTVSTMPALTRPLLTTMLLRGITGQYSESSLQKDLPGQKCGCGGQWLDGNYV